MADPPTQLYPSLLIKKGCQPTTHFRWTGIEYFQHKRRFLTRLIRIKTAFLSCLCLQEDHFFLILENCMQTVQFHLQQISFVYIMFYCSHNFKWWICGQGSLEAQNSPSWVASILLKVIIEKSRGEVSLVEQGKCFLAYKRLQKQQFFNF